MLADGFTYSSCSCNATEQALDKFRDYINKALLFFKCHFNFINANGGLKKAGFFQM